MELKDLKTLIENLLQDYPALRGKDDVLYLEVLRKTHPYWNSGRITTNIENMPIGEFFSERKNMKLPSFESVTRCRRKVQEERPDLKPCKKIQEARTKREEEFYNWSKMKQGEFDF